MSKNMKAYRTVTLVALIAVFIIVFIAVAWHINGSPPEPESQPAANQETLDGTPAEGTGRVENPPSDKVRTDAQKYYDYFAEHNYRINPIFEFSPDKASDDSLMVFAIMNLPNYNYETGNTKEEIDAVLNKFFGRTVKNYVTGMTEYVPGTSRIRSIGWDVNGGNRLVLTKLITNSDESFTGYFDVYHIPELYAEENNLKDFRNEIDGLLLSGNPGRYSELLSYKTIINFKELPEADGSFYLRYNSIHIYPMDNPMFPLYPDDELDARTFEAKDRFAAQEATFNGIGVHTTKEKLIEKLGEPYELIAAPDPIPTQTYVYGGVEYIFEAGGNTVDCINVTHFQWKYGPRNIRAGESFEEVLARFPQEQDYRTHPNGNFYGETTYLEEGGAVYYNSDGSVDNITVVPKEILPFMKIYFRDGKVSGYTIYGTTT